MGGDFSLMQPSSGFSPHGYCLLWDPSLLWLHILSDAMTGVAYIAISIAMVLILRKRFFAFSWMVMLFAAFIMACGLTHFMDIWTIWVPDYHTSGIMKLVTALISVISALAFIPLIPRIIRIPSLETTTLDLQHANVALSQARLELERKVEERTAQLQKSNHLSEEIIQGLPGLFYLFDSNMHLLRCNRYFEQVTGYSSRDILGKHALEFIAPNDRERVSERIRAVFSVGKSSVEAGILTGEGRAIPYYLNGIRVELDGERHLLGVGLDISERTRLEEDLIQAKDRAEAANRAKSIFLATMSHEIRTPMNVVMAMAELLQEPPLSAAQKECVDRLQSSSQFLLTVINQVLDLSKIEAGRLEIVSEPTCIRPLMEEVIAMMRTLAWDKGLPIRLDVKDRVPAWLSLDGGRLRQILLNLLSNAVKFTENGGIDLKAEVMGLPAMLHITVTDTGIGMDMDQLDRIFDSFAQVDASITRRYGGTGLGLTISRGLVELMGGRLWVESQLGVGSTFHVHLPLCPCVEPSEALPLLPSSTLGWGAAAQVLLVDDAEDNRMVVSAFLKGTSHQLLMANHGEEAVRMVQEHTFDIVFMDVHMPVMDGYTATRLIRQWEAETRRRPLPIVALTANALEDEIHESARAGCDMHLTKPVRKQQVLDVIRRFCSGSGSSRE
ncbi:MAG: response regulator [Magnetococcales bacterium]|nr:response regulator [Magnetococcales bacterium]